MFNVSCHKDAPLIRSRQPRIGVIGYGAVGEEIVHCLELRGDLAALVGMLDVPANLDLLRGKANGRFSVVATLEELLALRPDIVIEAAGHAALKRFGPEVLSRGIDLMIGSVGVISDRDVAAEMVRSAPVGTEIWIASGAVAGIDGLLAARTLKPHSITYTSVKPPVAWEGTPAEKLVAGHRSDRFVFFEGSAREASMQYPQNANVAATVALAGVGLDHTQVRLVSDPAVSGPVGIIEAEGEFGRFVFETLALATPSNPKSSALTGHSFAAAALDGMCFRALDVIRAGL
jgi:aspartate dehydrogenase